TLPAHGFARSLEWQYRGADAATATFTCNDSEATRAMWNHAFQIELTVSLLETLSIKMLVRNTGEQSFSFEQALHTYFAAGDVNQASVHGLANVPCVEHAREPEASADRAAPIRFRAEAGRVFQQVPDQVSLQATALARVVTLRTTNCNSAIVWNPWPTKTARLSQMRPDDWRSFVCIESANVGDNHVTLAPGGQHEMTLTLS